jgi:hypothetical protein
MRNELENLPSPGTFKQAMNLFFSMTHLWDGSHSKIRGSCMKSVVGEDSVALLSLSLGSCRGSSFLPPVPSVELSFLLLPSVSFFDPPPSRTSCLFGSVSSGCPDFSTPGCVSEPSPFVPSGTVS